MPVFLQSLPKDFIPVSGPTHEEISGFSMFVTSYLVFIVTFFCYVLYLGWLVKKQNQAAVKLENHKR